MSAFDDEDFDIDMAIEQSLLDEDMHLLPPSQSVGQLAPQEEMQSWIDAVENVAAVEDPVVPSVPPFGSGLTIGIIVLALSYFHIERLQWHADWARSVFRARTHAMYLIPQVVPNKMPGISSSKYTIDVIRCTPCGDARTCMIVHQCTAVDICLFVFVA